MSCEFEDNDM